MSYFHTDNIRKAMNAAGKPYFSPGTMRFFGSRVLGQAFCEVKTGRYYFATSERYGGNTARLYTVRVFDPVALEVDTVGVFQGYKSGREALAAARRVASGEKN